MRARSIQLALVAAIGLAAGSLGSAHAAITVRDDSGTFDGFTLKNVDGVNFTLSLDNSRLTKINGVLLGSAAPALFNSPINFKLTGGAGTHDYTFSSGDLDKWFDPTGNNTHLTYKLTRGTSVHLGDTATLVGRITGAPQPILTWGSKTYDFSKMLNQEIGFTLIDHGGSFFNVFNTAGASISGSGAFAQQTVVPEPTSVALLGVGLAGLIAFRRRLRLAGRASA